MGPPVQRGGQRQAPHSRRSTLREPAPPPEVICGARPRVEARCNAPPLQPLQPLPHHCPARFRAGGGVGPYSVRQREHPATNPPQRPQTLLPRQESEKQAGSASVPVGACACCSPYTWRAARAEPHRIHGPAGSDRAQPGPGLPGLTGPGWQGCAVSALNESMKLDPT